MYQEDDYLLISGIQHYVFCKRQWGLIHLEQQWEDNYLTTSGELMHEHAHDDSLQESRPGMLVLHNYPVCSATLGITGCCDILECTENPDGIVLPRKKGKWTLTPVEYKRGKPKEHDADVYQLCAQVLCLEEMHHCSIPSAYLYYGQTRHRLLVQIDDILRTHVKDLFQEMHATFDSGHIPQASYSKRCKACSVKDICMPQIEKLTDVSTYITTHIEEKE